MGCERIKKTAQEVLDGLCTGEGFHHYEEMRTKRTRGILSRVLLDISFQELLCAEYDLCRRGFPIRSEYPEWARRLADVLMNPDGKYSQEVRALVFESAQMLYVQSGRCGLAGSFVEYLGKREEVAILSEIARHLLL